MKSSKGPESKPGLSLNIANNIRNFTSGLINAASPIVMALVSEEEIDVGTPTNCDHTSPPAPRVVMTLGSDDECDENVPKTDANFGDLTRRDINRLRRRARKNWYRKMSLVDQRARSDPRLQVKHFVKCLSS
jgi:hypothetical protein